MPFHSGLIGKYDKRYYEIYKDPTPDDLKLLRTQTEHPEKLRLLLTEAGDLYAFTIELLHNLATAELQEEGISVVCFLAENKMEVADVGNLDVDDLVRAIQKAARKFRQLGMADDTQVRLIINQGLWADETRTFKQIVEKSGKNFPRSSF